MYTTKTHFPKKSESYVTIGDPYAKKSESNPRWKGKQFTTVPPKQPAGGAGYFSKFAYKPEPYVTQVPFLKIEPPEKRKLGFGTRDAHKSAEFTNTLRTEQYREQLTKELQVEEGVAEATFRRSQGLMEDVGPRRMVWRRSSEAIGRKCAITDRTDKATHGRTCITSEFYDRGHL